MQAVVIYESMFGNTHAIAREIAAGLAGSFNVLVLPVTQADPAQISEADLVVVGGPTHVHGMARASTRKAAAKQAEQGSGLRLEPEALRAGLREWLPSLGNRRGHGLAAAFDTRLAGPPAFTGRASQGIGKALRRSGYELIAAPESFIVTKQNTLRDGELVRAEAWGAALRGALSLTS
jgi:hypothetical protein